MTKDEFIIKFNNLIEGLPLSDEDFNSIIELLRIQNIIKSDFTLDPNKSQSQNILSMIGQNTISFYGTYLGQ